jgi:biotin/methionine sulfoxide reductase
MPGVIQLPTGAWFDPDPALDVERHGNPNVLTRDKGTSRLSQGPIAHSCLVDVRPWSGKPPSVESHAPPRFLTRPGREAG